MKTLFGMAVVITVAAVSITAVDNAEARGPRGAGNVSMGNIQVGPRVTAPVIRPNQVGPQFPRQITGPRESGRVLPIRNCRMTLPWRDDTGYWRCRRERI
jgi:hypothetical protein